MGNEFTSDAVVGIECHVELNTNTKLFCSCPRKGTEEPNSRCCEICLGHPGSKPSVNKKAIEFALKLCLATNSKIAKELVFSRKSYFYPDLAKNFQITQYEMPLGSNGEIKLPGKAIKLKRIHLEEDPASMVHSGSYVLVDYNRSGNPLVEIVTEPVMESAQEARDFMKQLITVLEYLEIFDINNCVIKADVNVSVRESGYSRVEVKNITGFKEIERAVNYEVQRQKHEAKDGKKAMQETRGWDADKGMTFPMRQKESEEDYGYIIEPDLAVIDITDDFVGKIKLAMPEMADEKLRKFLDEHGIEETTANVIAKDRKLAKMYEEVIKEVDRELASKWIRRELPRVLNYQKKSLEESNIEPKHMISLLKLIQHGKITEKTGQQLINMLGEAPFDVDEHVKKEGLSAVSDSSQIEQFCKEAIKEAPKAVEEYKAGKEKALNFCVGIVMKKSKGKVKPETVMEMLKKLVD